MFQKARYCTTSMPRIRPGWIKLCNWQVTTADSLPCPSNRPWTCLEKYGIQKLTTIANTARHLNGPKFLLGDTGAPHRDYVTRTDSADKCRIGTFTDTDE